MTTVLADIVKAPNSTPIGPRLKIRRVVHNDTSDITKKFNFSASAPTILTMFPEGNNTIETLNIPDNSFTALASRGHNTFIAPQSTLDLATFDFSSSIVRVEPVSANLTIEPISPAILSNEVSEYIASTTPSTEESKIFFTNNNVPAIQTATNFLFTTPASGSTTLSLPSTSTTLANSLITDNVFSATQVFNNNLLTSAIMARTANSNLNITPNGTGRVEIIGTEKIDNLKAKTNTPLLLSGNNLSPVSFGTSGFKFVNETLKDYTQNTFGLAFTIGAFTTGFLTVHYERIGKEVTIRVPAALGTPTIDGIWTSGVIPAIITPATTQVVQATIGLRNGSQKIPLALRINSTGTLVVGLNNFLAGFGNSGNCGWQIAWSVTYDLE